MTGVTETEKAIGMIADGTTGTDVTMVVMTGGMLGIMIVIASAIDASHRDVRLSET